MAGETLSHALLIVAALSLAALGVLTFSEASGVCACPPWDWECRRRPGRSLTFRYPPGD